MVTLNVVVAYDEALRQLAKSVVIREGSSNAMEALSAHLG